MRASELRIALYSHDTCGLGHLRRNLLVGSSLLSSRTASNVLLISGAREISAYKTPSGLDILTLPSIKKSATGEYRSRRFRMDLETITDFRSQVIAATLDAFAPDIFIVDNVPGGVNGELIEALRALRWHGETQVILGLRDVLDSPDKTIREWDNANNFSLIRELFDEIWIYGDPSIFAAHREYDFPEDISRCVFYTGYFDRVDRSTIKKMPGSRSDLRVAGPIVCLVGGGQDGFKLATNFLSAARRTRDRAIILAGPYMPEEMYQTLLCQAVGESIEVRRFESEPLALIHSARRVVSMGGYNTICELLCLNVPTLVVPRTRPRKEQLVRAEILAKRGVLDFLHPESATPDSIAEWLQRDNLEFTDARELIRFDAVDSLEERIEALTNRLRVA